MEKIDQMKTVLYSGVGPDLTQYEVDVESATLEKRESVKLPESIQYAWPHPLRRFLYVTSSNRGSGATGDEHHVTAFRISPSSGALGQLGEPVRLRSRPIHNSVGFAGDYLLVAYNNPSAVSVHRINSDGSIGEEIAQPENLDVGFFPHQILATPSNRSVILVTRGSDATPTKTEDPGSLKVFGFKDGRLTNKAAVQPGNGLGFGPRHLDFHPSRPWVYVSDERQNKLYVYELQLDRDLSPTPLFVSDTVLDLTRRVSDAGPIHVHPNGKFVYLANRGGWSDPVPADGTYAEDQIHRATNSNIAVFAIEQQTGEPELVQTIDSYGAHPRTFSFDAGGRVLVAGSLAPIALREDGHVRILPAGLSMFRVGEDGKLEYARRYSIETGRLTQWWTGLVSLA